MRNNKRNHAAIAENLEAANWAYKKRVEAFREWLEHNGTAEGQEKFTELFGERDA